MSNGSSNEYTLIKASRLFDGVDGSTRQNQAVLMANGNIDQIGSASDLRAPDGATVEVKDYGDATILPGLVDGHTHMMAPGDGTPGDQTGAEEDDILLTRAISNARAFLHAGVTTARENGAKKPSWILTQERDKQRNR